MPRFIRVAGLIFSATLLFATIVLAAEEITITTYYPSPYGSYNELTTASNTYLATASGSVGIGTASPTTGKLVVSGGNVDVTGNKITNVATPTLATDAATKGYVDAAGGGGCYTNYGQNTCAAGWTAVLQGYTTIYLLNQNAGGGNTACSSITHTAVGGLTNFLGSSANNNATLMNNEPCAICCK